MSDNNNPGTCMLAVIDDMKEMRRAFQELSAMMKKLKTSKKKSTTKDAEKNDSINTIGDSMVTFSNTVLASIMDVSYASQVIGIPPISLKMLIKYKQNIEKAAINNNLLKIIGRQPFPERLIPMAEKLAMINNGRGAQELKGFSLKNVSPVAGVFYESQIIYNKISNDFFFVYRVGTSNTKPSVTRDTVKGRKTENSLTAGKGMLIVPIQMVRVYESEKYVYFVKCLQNTDISKQANKITVKDLNGINVDLILKKNTNGSALGIQILNDMYLHNNDVYNKEKPKIPLNEQSNKEPIVQAAQYRVPYTLGTFSDEKQYGTEGAKDTSLTSIKLDSNNKASATPIGYTYISPSNLLLYTAYTIGGKSQFLLLLPTCTAEVNRKLSYYNVSVECNPSLVA